MADSLPWPLAARNDSAYLSFAQRLTAAPASPQRIERRGIVGRSSCEAGIESLPRVPSNNHPEQSRNQAPSDGDVAALTSGFHPVVAAPGHRLCNPRIMAGERRALHPCLDPRYRWLNEQQ
jgi:hypothetical protein